MGLEWSLQQIDPTTQQDVGEVLYDYDLWDPLTIDLMLTGEDEGPVAELVASGETGCDHPPDLDWSSHVCPPSVIPVTAVRRCDARLSGMVRSGYTSLEIICAGPLKDYSPREQQSLYTNLVDCVDRFRRFIAESAGRGHALRCSMH